MESITLNQENIAFTIDTETSMILFTEDKIYKVKKSVVIFPFIDYSTKEKRYTKIIKEFSKGKEYSPEIYICIILLNAPNINSEPSICMSRGKPSRSTLFDYLSTNHNVKNTLLDILLKDIKQFHTKTRIILPTSSYKVLSLKQRFNMLYEEAVMLDKRLNKSYLLLIDSFITYYNSKYDERIKSGCIRDLHGDLHSSNILFDEEKFYFFDFLDFDDSYTSGDYLNDIGFFLADMYFFGLITMESDKIERIADYFEDEPSLLLLFTAYGALNRANVYLYYDKQKADSFYDISYRLLYKGREYL